MELKLQPSSRLNPDWYHEEEMLEGQQALLTLSVQFVQQLALFLPLCAYHVKLWWHIDPADRLKFCLISPTSVSLGIYSFRLSPCFSWSHLHYALAPLEINSHL
jgi:hypothetical protein